MKFTNKVYDTDVQEQYDVDKKGPSKTPGQKMDIDKRNKRFRTPPCMIDNKQAEQPEYMNKIIPNKSVSQIMVEAKKIKESVEPYIENLAIDNSEEDTENLNDMAFKPEQQEPDLPILKVIKGKNRFNPQKMRGSSLRVEYFRNLLNSTKELNEEI